MTKAEAKIAIKEGKKVAHRYYSEGEFIHLDERGDMRFEDGVLVTEDYWQRIEAEEFDTCWTIVE